MALQKQTITELGSYDYWVIAPDFYGNSHNDELVLTMYLFKDREYEHDGFKFIWQILVTIKFSDWVAMFLQDADNDATRASYKCVKLLTDWQDATDILETDQVG